MGEGMKKTKTFDDLLEPLEFYTECPECGRDEVILKFYVVVECPHCGWRFKPVTIYARSKPQGNPSLRGFKMGGRTDGNQAT